MTLKDWIDKESECDGLLPFCHTTRWSHFEKILTTGKLQVGFSSFPDRGITVPGLSAEEMVYLFYGLPFFIYEVGAGDNVNVEATEDLPIGLIFKPELVMHLKRLYPFDTGALFTKLFGDDLRVKDAADITYYELPLSDGSEIKRLVSRYFVNNERYCWGRYKENVSPKSPKEENLLRLYKHGTSSKVDLRRRALEVHSLHDINIADWIIAVVVPMLRSATYSSLLSDLKNLCPHVEVIQYHD